MVAPDDVGKYGVAVAGCEVKLNTGRVAVGRAQISPKKSNKLLFPSLLSKIVLTPIALK
jgi:hypothetical protein